MKTLDEVIKANECCDHCEPDSNCKECPYISVPACALERENDTLHYLNTIETTENLYHDAVNELSKWKDEDWKDRCLPLTWDELRTMEGKPVWVEIYDPIDEKTGWHTASWKLIEFINDEYFDVRDSDGEQECFYKIENDWKAYRKERHEES